MARLRKKQLQDETKIVLPGAAPEGLLDVQGAAKWLGVSRTTLFDLMREEGFPVIRLTERLLKFDVNSLYYWTLTKRGK